MKFTIYLLENTLYYKDNVFRESENQREKKETTRTSKLKRFSKKGRKIKKEKSKEIREGKTYESGVLTATSSTNTDNHTIECIPPPEPEAEARPIPLKATTCVYFDLETTGFGICTDKIQIAAAYGQNTFCRYIVPKQAITSSAAKVTGFSKSGQILYRNGEIMQTDDLQDSLKDFINWLPDNCILLAHNEKLFDSRVIVYSMENNSLFDSFEQKCKGFVDSLSLLKTVLPERKQTGKRFNQESLVFDILGVEYDAHNAVGDVESLQQLVEHLSLPTEKVAPHSFSVEYVSQSVRQLNSLNKRLASFTLPASVLSKGMVRKMAKSGLEQRHLILANEREGSDGVANLLSELFWGKPRVTKDRKIIASVTSFIESRH
ncbi:unnamed protein product [Mytilus coruscus]|uniref:Exonuclease domain-containing protein n=1 Tax=Mytilus coruscus TaxID=42192 RepID=A0A6J8CBA4_MYTCO|nr:unnamed protein product [Mytilus coruscus]